MKSRACMTADRQANSSEGFCTESIEKVAKFESRYGDFAIGVVGSFRVRDLIFESDWSDSDGSSVEGVREIRDRVADLVDEESGKNYSESGDLSFQLVILCEAGIYSMASDMQLSEHKSYYAIGSGTEVACGSLHRTWMEASLDLEQATKNAVEAACTHRSDCGMGMNSIILTARKDGVKVSEFQT